jgi:hypothetical protein
MALEAGEDFQSTAALIIFCLAVAAVLLLVLWPLYLTVPCIYVGPRCVGLWPIAFALPWRRPSKPAGGGAHAAATPLVPLQLPLPYCWAPVVGVALMLICRSMHWADVWTGLVGDDHIQPYGIMVCAREGEGGTSPTRPLPTTKCRREHSDRQQATTLAANALACFSSRSLSRREDVTHSVITLL